ncbi:MAG: iron-only hydrogenase system regulator [Ruminococcaceae bacterium]|nr:iron-only hydrogenase system regulator [Oscillospiraceae bacterium]
METRVAIIGIIVENNDVTEQLNKILHQYANYIIGRMGLPYHERQIAIISVVVDAPQDVISALSGKLGMLPDVSTKTIYSTTTGGGKA